MIVLQLLIGNGKYEGGIKRRVKAGNEVNRVVDAFLGR